MEKRVYLLLLLLLLLIGAMLLTDPYMFSLNNILGITQFGAVLALLAIGQALIMTSGGGGIDLSVGSMVSLSGITIGLLVQGGTNIWLAALIGVLAGCIFGAINATNIVIIGIPPLIGTIGTMYVYSSLALVFTGGIPISGFPDSFGFLGQGAIFGVPTQVGLITLPIFIIVSFVVYRTVFGRQIYLIGTNEVAARFAGISVKKTRFLLYTFNGFLSGIGAVVMCSWLMTARPDVGTGLELQSITVAVLGGMSIFGGQGHLAGVMLAVLFITMVSSGLQMSNVNSIWELAILGIILILAVALNQFLLNKSKKLR